MHHPPARTCCLGDCRTPDASVLGALMSVSRCNATILFDSTNYFRELQLDAAYGLFGSTARKCPGPRR
jgi:hypothetical protein